VNVANTPLPVIGKVTATMSGNVSANIFNPANNPVLIRDVDAQSAKELWQTNRYLTIADGTSSGELIFDPVPPGKALVIERSLHFQNPSNLSMGALTFSINNTNSFNADASSDVQYFEPVDYPAGSFANIATKLYVSAGNNLRVWMFRKSPVGQGFGVANVTGYLVNHP
jgi:hypothetical protein